MASTELDRLHQADDDLPGSALSDTEQEKDLVDSSAFQGQINRILRSDELHSSEVLRCLLKFLADRLIAGDADELKEYTIAVEALAKPSTYDPRHSSAVRILVGRLRQKLANYYQREGLHDKILIDLPKGRFKLKCELRETPASTAPSAAALSAGPVPESLEAPVHVSLFQDFKRIAWKMIPVAWVGIGILIALAGEAIVHRSQSAKPRASNASYPPGWDASLEELWKPFIATNRPIIMAIEDPLFVELDVNAGIYYRDRTVDTWNQVLTSPKVAAIRNLLKTSDIEPSRYYTAFGEVDASFLIAKLLGSWVDTLSVARTSDVSTRELADNNVVFVGNETKFFSQQIQASPIELLLEPADEAIRNLHPGPNEPALFVDHYSTAPSEEGYAYALVTHVPGPLGSNDVESFTSSRAAGYVAAVKAFTNPQFVRPLLAELKQAGGGKLPRYYQVLLKVQFKDQVPTEITEVLCHELKYKSK